MRRNSGGALDVRTSEPGSSSMTSPSSSIKRSTCALRKSSTPRSSPSSSSLISAVRLWYMSSAVGGPRASVCTHTTKKRSTHPTRRSPSRRLSTFPAASTGRSRSSNHGAGSGALSTSERRPASLASSCCEKDVEPEVSSARIASRIACSQACACETPSLARRSVCRCSRKEVERRSVPESIKQASESCSSGSRCTTLPKGERASERSSSSK
mmetsp:Transcript_38829/g.90803  ORF Transcript_38829/g.90803 Transcript_38829/m.90803 type:complete len:212 (+) Transcript_38829:1543-2178(+)